MPIIKILPHPEYCPQGDSIEAPAGTSICEALLENGIAIEHACEMRSEEHTSELQSPLNISYAVFCLDRKSVV